MDETKATKPRDIVAWSMLNLLWAPLTAQDTALMTIAVPAAMLKIEPHNTIGAVALLGTLAALPGMVVQPLAGWLSDYLRRNGGSRRLFVAAGIAIDVIALLLLAMTSSFFWFAVLLLLATAGANMALAAYQALLPECVPRQHWGLVSGIRGVAFLFGTVVGVSVAGVVPDYHLTFVAVAVLMVVGALSLFGVSEGLYDNEEHVQVREWHDFMIVFVARVLVFFGLVLLQTYVLLFFNDVVKVGNPSSGTMLYAFAAMIGTLISSVALGALSDRVSRKLVTALSGIPMTLAVVGFALSHDLHYILPLAVLFGLGFGGVISSGWALAFDTVPELRDVARDLGLWGIATNLPNVVAPQAGRWLIGLFHETRAGYQAVFGLAGFSFALASLVVLRVGRKPLSSYWAWPGRFAAVTSNFLWNHYYYRVRDFGRLPWRRGATVIVANHQADVEGSSIVGTTTVKSGPWRHPIYMACSRRMYEPGFLAWRLPWFKTLLRRYNPGPLFMSLGMLPIENELSSREIAGVCYAIQSKHGKLPLTAIFDERVASRFPAGTTTDDFLTPELFGRAQELVKLSALKEPYRKEAIEQTRALVEEDLARFEDVVKRGGTVYLTPEGVYSVDGRIGRMRGMLDRLAPLATIYLACVSYDPFVSKRLSLLYRIVRLDDKAQLVPTLAANRPVTTSQLLATWLQRQSEPFDADAAVEAVSAMLAALPPALFVDPELRADPAGMTRKALTYLPQLGVLHAEGEAFRVEAERKDPRFPQAPDIVAFQANVLTETLENVAFAIREATRTSSSTYK